MEDHARIGQAERYGSQDALDHHGAEILAAFGRHAEHPIVNKIKTLQDVVDWGLCTGCGACYYSCTEKAVALVNVESVGIRPKFENSRCGSCTKCLSICPGYSVDAHTAAAPALEPSDADHAFGAALEIWEGYASDPEIRFRGSSGGILTALALYCIEREDMSFVLHTAMDEERPWLNKTVKSHTREELLGRTGSRYAPSSPCAGMAEIEGSDKPCVFIGKPCDTAAASMLRLQNPELDRKLGLVLTFFCAGTPSTQGTLDVAHSLGVRPEQIDSLHYRGDGWPGQFRIICNGGKREESLSYDESWSKLTHYRPMRCNLCPDGLGRVADISCGDAWENSSNNGNPGVSLVVVRTTRGQRILRKAVAANYVSLQRVSAANVFAAQGSLLGRRTEIWGRTVSLKLFGIPTPIFRGFSLFRSWLQLPLRRKAITILGTARRAMQRKLYRRRPVIAPQDEPGRAAPVKSCNPVFISGVDRA